MDGNGRWAKQRHLPRVEGHRNGVESVRAVVRAAGEAGVKYLTLYAFSVENWNRPKDEVDTLMKYLARFLKAEIGELNRNNVRLDAIGQIYRLPEFVQEQLEKTKAALAKNSGLTLILAFSYGGRTEMVEAVRGIGAKGQGRPNWSRRRSTSSWSRSIFTPGIIPTPTCSFAPAARCASAIFCCGRFPTRNWSSRPRSGPIFASRSSSRRSKNTPGGTAALAWSEGCLCRNPSISAAGATVQGRHFLPAAGAAFWSCGRSSLAALFSGHKALSDYVFLLIILVLAVSGLMEFYGMAQSSGYACYSGLGVCGGVLMILFTFVCISGEFGRAVTPSRDERS